MTTHFYFDGHTYEIETAVLTADSAATNATSLAWGDNGRIGATVSSYLANIGSAAENAAILKNIKTSGIKGESSATDGGGCDYLWLGASDTALEGNWLWLDGTGVSSTYQNWGSGVLGTEPDNYNGNQDYMAIASGVWPANGGGLGVAGQWNDLSGANLIWSIIEWNGLIGTAAAEKLTGTNGDDIIDGAAGNDKIKSGSGNDTIYAGEGDDTIDAGNGDNEVYAQTGTIDSNDGNDRVKSGDGDDFIAPGTGNDVVDAGDGDNTVIGGSGDDKITTGSGDDVIDIDGYYITTMTGAEGNDTIKTGAGDDYIVLGTGHDKVWGGEGADTFLFNSTTSTTSSTTINTDGSRQTTLLTHIIYDFNAGSNGASVDRLELKSSVFTAFAGGFEATNFIKGKGLSSASANETGVDDYLIYDSKSGKLYYDADGNGSSAEAILIGIVKGKMSDFNFEDISII